MQLVLQDMVKQGKVPTTFTQSVVNIHFKEKLKLDELLEPFKRTVGLDKISQWEETAKKSYEEYNRFYQEMNLGNYFTGEIFQYTVAEIVDSLIKRGKKPYSDVAIDIISWGPGSCYFEAQIIRELMKIGYKINNFVALEKSKKRPDMNDSKNLTITNEEMVKKFFEIFKFSNSVFSDTCEEFRNLKYTLTKNFRKIPTYPGIRINKTDKETIEALKKVDLFLASNPRCNSNPFGANDVESYFKEIQNAFKTMNEDTSQKDPFFVTSIFNKIFTGQDGQNEFMKYVQKHISMYDKYSN